MTHDPTDMSASAAPRRPVATLTFCDECMTGLEELRTTVGEQGTGWAFCPHAPAFALWSDGAITFRACETLELAQKFGLVAQAIATAHRTLAKTVSDHLRAGAAEH